MCLSLPLSLSLSLSLFVFVCRCVSVCDTITGEALAAELQQSKKETEELKALLEIERKRAKDAGE